MDPVYAQMVNVQGVPPSMADFLSTWDPNAEVSDYLNALPISSSGVPPPPAPSGAIELHPSKDRPTNFPSYNLGPMSYAYSNYSFSPLLEFVTHSSTQYPPTDPSLLTDPSPLSDSSPLTDPSQLKPPSVHSPITDHLLWTAEDTKKLIDENKYVTIPSLFALIFCL